MGTAGGGQIGLNVSRVGKWASDLLPFPLPLLEIVDLFLSFAVIALLFAVIYRFIPDVEIRWRDVWVGAGMTALLFTIGKTLIGIYLGRSSVASVYRNRLPLPGQVDCGETP